MTLWFISDTHFGHKNMTEMFKRADGSPVRPFPSVEACDAFMLDQWATLVQPSDHIYHLGDVTMDRGNHYAWLHQVKKLPGHKRLILGNHDHFKVSAYVEYGGFQKVKASTVLEGLLFTHYPIHEQSIRNAKANVHGHLHQHPAYGPRYVNISVEMTAYAPISLEEIRQKITRQQGQLTSPPPLC